MTQPAQPPVPEPAILAALLRLHRLATSAADPATALDALAAEAAELFGADLALVALVDPVDGSLALEASRGLPSGNARHHLPTRQGLVGWSTFHGRPALLQEVEGDWRYVPLRASTRCEMAAPLGDERHVLGAISVGSDSPGRWDASHLAAFDRLAAEATGVLRLIWQHRQFRAQANQLAVLIDIGQQLVAKVDQQELLDLLVREALRLAGCTYATLLLLGPDRDTLIPTSAAASPDTTPPPALPLPDDCGLPIADTLAGTVVQTKKPLEVTNVLAQEYFDCDDVPRDRAVRTLLATPLLAEGEVLGTLNVFTAHAHRFDNDEKRVLLALASMGAVAIRNARLYARSFQAEETLQRSEKLTTLGLLAAEIAHEIRNPLTVLKLLFGSLGLDFPPGDPRRKDVEIIGEKLNHLEDIVGRVLSFGRAPSAMHSRWALDGLVQDTLLLVRLKLRQARVEARAELPTPGIFVEASRGQIQQVLLNLIINAVQAMPQGGRLTIRVFTEPSDALNRAVVEVEDTGLGIPPDVGRRIFDSFLTGRPDGTGLGLSISKRILLSHRGDIGVASTGPSGTTLRFRLPLASAPD